MSRKLHVTIRSGGPASWAIRAVTAAAVVWLVLWVSKRTSCPFLKKFKQRVGN